MQKRVCVLRVQPAEAAHSIADGCLDSFQFGWCKQKVCFSFSFFLFLLPLLLSPSFPHPSLPLPFLLLLLLQNGDYLVAQAPQSWPSVWQSHPEDKPGSYGQIARWMVHSASAQTAHSPWEPPVLSWSWTRASVSYSLSCPARYEGAPAVRTGVGGRPAAQALGWTRELKQFAHQITQASLYCSQRNQGGLTWAIEDTGSVLQGTKQDQTPSLFPLGQASINGVLLP